MVEVTAVPGSLMLVYYCNFDNREFKITTTTTATATSLNKRFNEQNNRYARAL